MKNEIVLITFIAISLSLVLIAYLYRNWRVNEANKINKLVADVVREVKERKRKKAFYHPNNKS